MRVEYTLQYDNGEPPVSGVWNERWANLESLVRQERPLEVGGMLVAPRQVLTADPMMDPRFIKSIAVRVGQQVVPAKFVGYGTDQPGAFLELSAPLPQAKPLAFDADKPGPYRTVTYQQTHGIWTVTVGSLSSDVSSAADGRTFRPAPAYCLITDKLGAPVGATMKDGLPLDDSWKGSPLQWPAMAQAEMAKMLADLDKQVAGSLPRVNLGFRSPRKQAGVSPSRYGGTDEPTEQNLAGVMLDERTILVPANLEPKTTARLERIMVYPAGGEPIPAKFVCTLADYGGFIATLDAPLPGKATLAADADLTALRNKLLLTADVRVQGEKRTVYFGHDRIALLAIGWKGNLYPGIRGPDTMFYFTPQGQLLILPIAHREGVSVRDRYRLGGEIIDTPATVLGPVLREPTKHADASNAPLTEADESRLAWLGVELQPLDKELARANKVSDLTQDGQTGALVSYVYPGSPADKSGIKPGYVLLRVTIEGEPKPLDVRLEESPYGRQPFPWERLDQLPEQYYDQVPQPWPSPENTLTRTLTDAGFGKKFQAEFFFDGKTLTKDFQVEQSPAYYETAQRYKSDLGITVRDLTYELRRYFQKTQDDPGVIVSKVEPGSKASVAGIKPYEMIVSVNDTPVRNVKDFERLANASGELRLSVSRMTKGRVVKITASATTQNAATRPASTQPAEE